MSIRIGIICPSEIAFRRFLPALKAAGDIFYYSGVAIATPEEWFGNLQDVDSEHIRNQQEGESRKAQMFVDTYGGQMYHGYETLVSSPDIDAIYIPLPPALHYRWAKAALERGKHVMVEKPSTCYLRDTMELVDSAREKALAIHENYMFVFHNQIRALRDVVSDGNAIGTPRLYRISFGFPRRSLTDFRYNRRLGGGALLDAGGYTLRYATEILGPSTRVTDARVCYDPDFEVDIFGTATLVNDQGQIVQTAFGMDNDYHCDVEIWGSKGTITSDRILTAPVGFKPSYTLKQNQNYSTFPLPEDDAFCKSLLHFAGCIQDKDKREENYQILLRQENLIEQFRTISGLLD